MKILSWNVYAKNKTLEKVQKHISDGGYDVVCLQEVPEEETQSFLDFFPHGHVAEEHLDFRKKKEVRKLNLVILTKMPIIQSVVVRHETSENAAKRYNNFYADFHYVDVSYNGETCRVFNTHFMCVASPYFRLGQLQEVLSHVPEHSDKYVICGDFNNFGMPVVNPFLAWHYGYSKKELFVNEKKLFNKFFEKHSLKNVFKGKRTFLWFPLQLDYILPAKGLFVLGKRVHPKTHGSDHYPIELSIRI